MFDMFDKESGFVRNVVNEIVRECSFKRLQINKNFATFLTNLHLLDPTWDIQEDFLCSRGRVEDFVKYVMEELLTKQESPKIITLKIQFYFVCNQQYSPMIVQTNRDSFKKKIEVLYKDIIECRKLETIFGVELLYKKMAYYMTLVTGLGNPTEPRVFAEALAALKSILKEDYLMEFIKLSKTTKKDEFQHFNNIVAGIRLYNRHLKVGGAGIPNLPELLYKGTVTIKIGIEETLANIKHKSQILTFVIRKNYTIAKTTRGYNMEVKFVGTRQQTDDINYMKHLLVFFKQYELIVKDIMKNVEEIEEELEKFYSEMKELLTLAHSSIHKKVAIPAEIVYPIFKKLWSMWEKFQNKALLLKRIITMMTNLQTYAIQTGYQYLKIAPIKNYNEAESNNFCLRSKIRRSYITIIKYEEWNELENVELEYLGFCPWTLMQTDGALIPGDPSMGVAEFHNKYYAFTCPEAFQEFDKNPHLCINSVLELARKQPQFINLLHLTKNLEKVYHIKNLIEAKADLRAYKDIGTQTEDHIVKSNIDLKYHWNVWDLKRLALTTAALSHSRTKACQSNKTTSKTNIGNQTYSTEKQVWTQTRKNAGSNGPKPSIFMYGLRGRRTDEQFKIDLTLPYK
ncbi:unnamed protein product [Ceutorhynchus assimilis]|uniref:Cilia- and flagella-associated protein 206 n=1 Tax=Ceutorhynchus assimilis TaxID=467358 RepID=A0A9P0DJA6_9CUCU|nr:unnamed protein product [Ceutorhynchus assimilis]